MPYDKRSFLAGIALGRQLKGWATGGEGGEPTPTDMEFVALAVTTPPNKVIYLNAESFDTTGMVVTGTWRIEGKAINQVVSGYLYTPHVLHANNSSATQQITVMYTSSGVTQHAYTDVRVGWNIADMRIWTSSSIDAITFDPDTTLNTIDLTMQHSTWDYIYYKVLCEQQTAYIFSFDVMSPTGFVLRPHSTADPDHEYFYIMSNGNIGSFDPQSQPDNILVQEAYQQVGENAGVWYHYDIPVYTDNLTAFWLNFGMGNISDDTSFTLCVKNITLTVDSTLYTLTWLVIATEYAVTQQPLSSKVILPPAYVPPTGYINAGWSDAPTRVTGNTTIHAALTAVSSLQDIATGWNKNSGSWIAASSFTYANGINTISIVPQYWEFERMYIGKFTLAKGIKHTFSIDYSTQGWQITTSDGDGIHLCIVKGSYDITRHENLYRNAATYAYSTPMTNTQQDWNTHSVSIVPATDIEVWLAFDMCMCRDRATATFMLKNFTYTTE